MVCRTLGRIDPSAIVRNLEERNVQLVITGKALSPKMLNVARLVHGKGIRVIADFCDDYFDHPEFSGLNYALAELADKLTCSTAVLADVIAQKTGRRPTIITDPYEGPPGAAKLSPGRERIELLWFGNYANYHTIEPLVPQLHALSLRHPLRLTIVTDLDRIAPLKVAVTPSFLVDYVGWTLPRMWQALAACDVVILPSLRNAHYDAKSPNRLVEALRAGRAVAAHLVPSYSDFAEFCWLGDDIAGAIAAMISDQGAAERRIAAGQAFVADRHAPDAIGEQWFKCIRA
jgi:glycosyltransferase involved in cell wall biosynthesis